MNNEIIRMYWKPGTFVKVPTNHGDRYGVIVENAETKWGSYGLIDYQNGTNGKIYTVHTHLLTEITEREYFAALLKGEQHAS